MGGQDSHVHDISVAGGSVPQYVWYASLCRATIASYVLYTLDGLYQITRKEGLPGLYKGTIMAVVGVSNGAIQFMAYEELKKIVRERKLRRSVGESEAVELVRYLLPVLDDVIKTSSRSQTSSTR